METSLAELTLGINTTWVLICAFMVFFMQAGFAMVTAGLISTKNTVNMLMKNLMDMCLAVLFFYVIGFGIMFGDGNAFMGTHGWFLSGFAETFAELPTFAFWFFQAAFAGVAATIVAGALAGRLKFNAYIVYTIAISAFIYPVVGHWIWGGGWLAEMGFADFAGSTVVHSVGGWAALVGAMILGPRIGRFNIGARPKAHSIPLVMLGVFILWFGWYGFNPGSQLAITGDNASAVSLIAMNTTLAAGAGALTALFYSRFRHNKLHAGYTMNGVLAGLVAITAGCAFVAPELALLIGAIGGIITSYGTDLMYKFKIDDAVGAFPVHAMAGVWGTFAVGLFHSTEGLFYGGGWNLLGVQAIGIVAVAAWVIVTMYVVFKVIDKFIGLRAGAEMEEVGLDSKHGVEAYDLQMTMIEIDAK